MLTLEDDDDDIFYYDEEGEPHMTPVQLHDYGACSSVLLKAVSASAPEHALRAMYTCLTLKVPGTGTLSEGHTLSEKVYGNYYFAQVCVSTCDFQTETNKVLRRLGFQTAGFSYNGKNSTSCALWVLDVPTFVSRVTELYKKREKGEPIDWGEKP